MPRTATHQERELIFKFSGHGIKIDIARCSEVSFFDPFNPIPITDIPDTKEYTPDLLSSLNEYSSLIPDNPISEPPRKRLKLSDDLESDEKKYVFSIDDLEKYNEQIATLHRGDFFFDKQASSENPEALLFIYENIDICKKWNSRNFTFEKQASVSNITNLEIMRDNTESSEILSEGAYLSYEKQANCRYPDTLKVILSNRRKSEDCNRFLSVEKQSEVSDHRYLEMIFNTPNGIINFETMLKHPDAFKKLHENGVSLKKQICTDHTLNLEAMLENPKASRELKEQKDGISFEGQLNASSGHNLKYMLENPDASKELKKDSISFEEQLDTSYSRNLKAMLENPKASRELKEQKDGISFKGQLNAFYGHNLKYMLKNPKASRELKEQKDGISFEEQLDTSYSRNLKAMLENPKAAKKLQEHENGVSFKMQLSMTLGYDHCLGDVLAETDLCLQFANANFDFSTNSKKITAFLKIIKGDEDYQGLKKKGLTESQMVTLLTQDNPVDIFAEKGDDKDIVDKNISTNNLVVKKTLEAALCGLITSDPANAHITPDAVSVIAGFIPSLIEQLNKESKLTASHSSIGAFVKNLEGSHSSVEKFTAEILAIQNNNAQSSQLKKCQKFKERIQNEDLCAT